MKSNMPYSTAKSGRPIVGYDEDGFPVKRDISGDYIDLSAEEDYRRYRMLQGAKLDDLQGVVPAKLGPWRWLRLKVGTLYSNYRVWRGIETYVGRAGELRLREAEREIRALQIKRSSDARLLFDEYAKRFFFVEKPDGTTMPPFRLIAEKGGNLHELAFVLGALFRWNNVEYEIESYYGDDDGNFGRGSIEYFLLYVPAIDKYFDPTMRITRRQESGWDPRDSNPPTP